MSRRRRAQSAKAVQALVCCLSRPLEASPNGWVLQVGVGVEVEEPGDEEEGGQHGDEREGDSERRVGGLLEREQRRSGKGI